MTQDDNETCFVLSWVRQFSDSFSGRRPLDEKDRLNADGSVRRVDGSDERGADYASGGGNADNGTADGDAGGSGMSGDAG